MAGQKKDMHHVGRDAVLYLLAFVLPMCTMLLILRQGGFYPFGNKTLFLMDMKGQYLEFFAYLRNMTVGDNSVFFSWSRSLGGNFLGLFAYYLASPLSFLTVFFPLERMDAAIVLLTVLKIGLCGLSFSVFANYLWKRQGEQKIFPLFILVFSTSYALISYNMVYSLCLMWLDGVILLPAILLGIEKILDGKRGLHYTLMIAVLFLCNYYTGYMVGIFSALYFLYRVLCNVSAKTVKKCIFLGVNFGICTVFAFGISAPLILPVAKDLFQGKLAMEQYIPQQEINFEFGQLFTKLKNGMYDSITNAGLPSIYCGIVIIVLAVGFFFCSGILIREKIGAAVLLSLLAVSFYRTDLDIAWHGFQYPTWFPYRYAFLFSFVMIYMAFRAAVSLVVKAVPWLLKKAERKGWMSRCAYVAMCILILFTVVDMETNGQAMLAGLDNEFAYDTEENYQAFLARMQGLVKTMKEKDDGLYRVNSSYGYGLNDGMLLGYNSMSHYSSTFHEAVNNLTSRLGFAQAHIWNSGYGSSILTDSLFGVAYKLSYTNEPPAYEMVSDMGTGVRLYQNSLALPLVYAASAAKIDVDLDQGEPFCNQSAMLSTITGKEQEYVLFYDYEEAQQDNGWSYTLTAETDDPLYLYMETGAVGWGDVYVNDVLCGNYFSNETNCLLYLGSFSVGQQVVVKVVPSQECQVDYAAIAGIDMKLLTSVINGLQDGGMQMTSHGHAKMSGTIRVQEGQMVVSSIPYDSGWTVTLDGKEVKTKKFIDTFLAIDAPAGEHEISFSYVSPGFQEGVIVFFITLVLAGIYFVFFPWKVCTHGDRLKNESLCR